MTAHLRLALKSFSMGIDNFVYAMGQYFDFIFEILPHGKTRSRSPALAQHLKSFSWHSISILCLNSISFLLFSVVRKVTERPVVFLPHPPAMLYKTQCIDLCKLYRLAM